MSAALFLSLSACSGGGNTGNNGGSVPDTTRPVVIRLQAISADGLYRIGDQITLSVTFSEPVYVTGVPRLYMQYGIAAQASYVSGSGTSSLTFVLTVQPGDSSADLEYYSSTQLILSSATVRDQAGNDSSIELPQVGSAGSLSTNSNIVVDGIIPFPSDVYAQSPSGTYFTGETITITIVFNEPVTVTGIPRLRLETGAVDAVATYVRGSSTNSLVFEYVVENSHTTDHLRYLDNDALLVTGANIQDVAGNRAQYYVHTIGGDQFINLLPSTWASLYDDALIQINPPTGPVDPTYGYHGRGVAEVNQYLALVVHAFGATKQGENILTCGLGVKTVGGAEIACTRFTSNGNLDSSYGNNGLLIIPESTPKITRLALQADGKILVAGNSYGLAPSTSDTLCRYLPDGAIDSTFGVSGSVSNGCIPGHQYIAALSVLGDGKIMVVSGLRGSPPYKVARYHVNGAEDLTFGPSNTNFIGINAGAIAIQSVDVQSDGKIVVGGFTGATYTMDAAIARFMQDGQPDTTFGTNGITSLNLGLDDEYADVRVQPSGGIVAVGRSNGKFLISKFTSQGAFDPSFDADGTVTTTAWGSSSAAERVLTEADGSFFVAGQAHTSLKSYFSVLKYLP